MKLDPQYIDILKWFGLGIAWLISNYITYRITRKTKHDDIQIGKRHALAQQISVLLQNDFRNRRALADQYQRNFGHIKKVSDAIGYFNQYQALYQDMREMMSALPVGIGKLEEANQSSAIYLDEDITSAINAYIENAIFSFSSDGMGVIDNFAERFFTTLLDPDRSARLAENYNAAMRGLRKAVR